MDMKKITLLFTILGIICGAINAQETVVVGWTFPENSAVADTGIDVNLDKEIYTMGGTSEIDFKNGFTSKAAQATEWHDGMDVKAWLVSFSTEGYSGLTISSMQSSGGNEPGPRDYKVQYSINNGSIWMDVADGDIAVENDWTTGVVENLELPSACNDKADVQIRWVMTSNEASGAGGAVLESGKSKIDEIYIRGDKISGINSTEFLPFVEVTPNPAKSIIHVRSENKMSFIQICDVSGKVILQKSMNSFMETIDVSTLQNGLYILSVLHQDNGNYVMQKIMVD